MKLVNMKDYPHIRVIIDGNTQTVSHTCRRCGSGDSFTPTSPIAAVSATKGFADAHKDCPAIEYAVLDADFSGLADALSSPNFGYVPVEYISVEEARKRLR